MNKPRIYSTTVTGEKAMTKKEGEGIDKMFKVLIGGDSKPRPDYRELYRNAYVRTIEALVKCPEDKTLISRFIFYCVRYYNHVQYDKYNFDEVTNRLQLIHGINVVIGQLTPRELMQIFPVQKTYDGHKCKCKDYFYTMNALRHHGLDKPIGEDVFDKILWDYMNDDIRGFVMGYLTTISALCQLEGGRNLIEKYAESQGKPLTIHAMTTDSIGRTFMTDSKTGETKRVYEERPSLKLVR